MAGFRFMPRAEPQAGRAPMKSHERKAARRKREDGRRAANLATRNKDLTLENVASMESLYRAHKQAKRNIGWKAATQNYDTHWLTNIYRQHDELMNGGSIGYKPRHFRIYERGIPRDIDAPAYEDKVTQKSITQNALIPAIEPTLIEWNSANRKEKGTLHAIKHLRKCLGENYRERGTDGYVLLMDYRGYFASIDHERVKEIISRNVLDQRIVRLACDFVDAQPEGLGLGSEPNQILAVALPNSIDHFITQNCGMRHYGRYMDDSWVMHPDKAILELVLGLAEDRCRALGITINARKTRIAKLSDGFTLFKKRVFYGEGGKVIIKPSKEAMVRERKTIRGHARLLRAGVMEYEDAFRSYQSWRGWQVHFNAVTAVQAMDAYFKARIGEVVRPDIPLSL